MNVVMLGDDRLEKARLALEYIRTGADAFGNFANMKEAEYVLKTSNINRDIALIKLDDPVFAKQLMDYFSGQGQPVPAGSSNNNTGLLIGGGIAAAALAFLASR